MNIVIDTSVVISVITNEKHKNELIKKTAGTNLVAPSSLHWELGNAFSAMKHLGELDSYLDQRQ